MQGWPSPAVISPLISPLLRTDSETATQKQRIASMGLGMFVMHRALRLPAPESLWFLFISPEENRKEKKKAEAVSCLLEFKEREPFRDNVGLRNSRRRAEE